MSDYKKFIPCIYLFNKEAVAGFNDHTSVRTDAAELAAFYEEYDADGLILFDLSEDDASHEANLDVIRMICRQSHIPVIGAGNIKRMEDVKKLLYAG